MPRLRLASALAAPLVSLLAACVAESSIVNDDEAAGEDSGGGRPDRPGRDSGASGDDVAERDMSTADDGGVGPTDAAPDDDGGAGSDTTAVADAAAETGSDPACITMSADGTPVQAPVDIIWVIDTSGSMDEEIELIEQRIPDFARYIGGAGLDYHVILLGADSICFPDPVSSGACPDVDTEHYRHVRAPAATCDAVGPEFEGVDPTTIIGCPIYSTDGLEKTQRHFPLYADFLRPDSVRHVVIVTDDESDMDADEFHAWASRPENLGPSYFFHTIASDTEEDECILFFCETVGCSGPYGDAEARGDEYMALSALTSGVVNSICEPDWNPVFEGIQDRVVETASLACTYAIPDPGDGLEIVYEDISVFYTDDAPGSSPFELARVTGPADCGPLGGWYFDDPAAPVNIEVCPATCGEGRGSVEIELGCVKG
jgi:hypothetical protein